jgi:hypothetical protein
MERRYKQIVIDSQCVTNLTPPGVSANPARRLAHRAHLAAAGVRRARGAGLHRRVALQPLHGALNAVSCPAAEERRLVWFHQPVNVHKEIAAFIKRCQLVPLRRGDGVDARKLRVPRLHAHADGSVQPHARLGLGLHELHPSAVTPKLPESTWFHPLNQDQARNVCLTCQACI